MGNPHAVIFLDEVEELQLDKIGPSFEKMSFFPNKTNTEFVKILEKNKIRMRVWERGSGETSACGTGACAVCAVATKLGLADFNTPITVVLDGGELYITVKNDYSVFMTGPCVESYKGILQDS